MSNPLSEWGVSDLDYAISVGALMGEETNVVGVGLVAASALNRADRPGAFLSQSARLGDIFSAPHRAENMAAHAMRGEALPRGVSGGRQYSTTINSSIPGASVAAFQNFANGIRAAYGAPVSEGYRGLFSKAQTALGIAVKADAIGIDLGFGITNYGTRGRAPNGQTYAARSGAGLNAAVFGAHSLGPFSRGVTPPSERDFAARFAAAASMVGQPLNDNLMAEVLEHATPTEISMAASVMPMQAALAPDYANNLDPDVWGEPATPYPGLTYGINGVSELPFSAVNVPEMTEQLGISPLGPMGFAFGPDGGLLTLDDIISPVPVSPVVAEALAPDPTLALDPIGLPGNLAGLSLFGPRADEVALGPHLSEIDPGLLPGLAAPSELVGLYSPSLDGLTLGDFEPSFAQPAPGPFDFAQAPVGDPFGVGLGRLGTEIAPGLPATGSLQAFAGGALAPGDALGIGLGDLGAGITPDRSMPADAAEIGSYAFGSPVGAVMDGPGINFGTGIDTSPDPAGSSISGLDAPTNGRGIGKGKDAGGLGLSDLAAAGAFHGLPALSPIPGFTAGIPTEPLRESIENAFGWQAARDAYAPHATDWSEKNDENRFDGLSDVIGAGFGFTPGEFGRKASSAYGTRSMSDLPAFGVGRSMGTMGLNPGFGAGLSFAPAAMPASIGAFDFSGLDAGSLIGLGGFNDFGRGSTTIQAAFSTDEPSKFGPSLLGTRSALAAPSRTSDPYADIAPAWGAYTPARSNDLNQEGFGVPAPAAPRAPSVDPMAHTRTESFTVPAVTRDVTVPGRTETISVPTRTSNTIQSTRTTAPSRDVSLGNFQGPFGGFSPGMGIGVPGLGGMVNAGFGDFGIASAPRPGAITPTRAAPTFTTRTVTTPARTVTHVVTPARTITRQVPTPALPVTPPKVAPPPPVATEQVAARGQPATMTTAQDFAQRGFGVSDFLGAVARGQASVAPGLEGYAQMMNDDRYGTAFTSALQAEHAAAPFGSRAALADPITAEMRGKHAEAFPGHITDRFADSFFGGVAAPTVGGSFFGGLGNAFGGMMGGNQNDFGGGVTGGGFSAPGGFNDNGSANFGGSSDGPGANASSGFGGSDGGYASSFGASAGYGGTGAPVGGPGAGMGDNTSADRGGDSIGSTGPGADQGHDGSSLGGADSDGNSW